MNTPILEGRMSVSAGPTVTMHMREPSMNSASYGVLWTSVETVTVTGRVHNRGSQHKVDIWRDESCTGGAGTHVLNVQAAVISAHPYPRPPRVGEVRPGDVIRLVFPDGRTEDYEVVTLPLRDPVLRPVARVDDTLHVVTVADVQQRLGRRITPEEAAGLKVFLANDLGLASAKVVRRRLQGEPDA